MKGLIAKMKIEAVTDDKIVIDLTPQDMDALDITYDEMDYSNIETRRVIWTLLDRAGKFLGRDIDPSGKMMIEAMPKLSGGCVIYFTIMCEREPEPGITVRPVLRKEELLVTYEFDNADDLLAAVPAMKKISADTYESELYENNGKYRLLIKSSGTLRSIKNSLCEFAVLHSEGECGAEMTREHWKEIVKDEALQKICRV